ncbi:MAG: rhodanese-like domain-containing protein [Bacteroidia bacterium]|nr:rhodanese-like domain-containing protein [Bacteroidia bacterium]
MTEITVHELNKRLKGGEKITLIDVREPFEYEMANIGGKLIPLGSIALTLPSLSQYKDSEVVVYCRSGARSSTACAFLRTAGFQKIRNLTGGILAWKNEIDPNLNVQ